MKLPARTRSSDRSHTRPAARLSTVNVAAAAAILAVLVMPLALAGAAEGPQATTTATTASLVKQLKKQTRQLERLKARVGALVRDGAKPSGPAGGDLDGSYPNPQIRAGSIGIDAVDASLHQTCLPTQRYLQGACIDAGLRPALNWTNARDDCLVVGARLPTLAELETFRVRAGVTLANPEWTLEITGAPPPTGQAYLINDAGEISQSNQAGAGVASRQFRCVMDPVA